MVTAPNVSCEKLKGGVSSEVILIEEGERRFVFKRALPELQVDAHWPADVERNLIEQDFFRYVSQFMPEEIPKIIYADRQNHFFCMEALGEEFDCWKNILMNGEFCLQTAEQAGKLLAKLHVKSLGCEKAGKTFDNNANFHDMRIHPYFHATAEKHPKLKSEFAKAASRLKAAKTCLIHGDFSPKNLMVNENKVIIIDAETACYGDPTFDIAFLLSHLTLKSFLFPQQGAIFMQLVESFLEQYKVNSKEIITLDENWLTDLIQLLLLARVDGMSPVEYLPESVKNKIRQSATKNIHNKAFTVKEDSVLVKGV